MARPIEGVFYVAFVRYCHNSEPPLGCAGATVSNAGFAWGLGLPWSFVPGKIALSGFCLSCRRAWSCYGGATIRVNSSSAWGCWRFWVAGPRRRTSGRQDQRRRRLLSPSVQSEPAVFRCMAQTCDAGRNFPDRHRGARRPAVVSHLGGSRRRSDARYASRARRRALRQTVLLTPARRGRGDRRRHFGR